MTSSTAAVLVFLHLVSAIVWLGGMVFAHFALRPAAVAVLEPPQRLPLMALALGRFFRLVAAAVIVILATGVALLAREGMAQAPVGWHVMLTLGLVMAAVFAVIFVQLYPALTRAVAAREWPAAAGALNRIRVLVMVNMGLGFAAVAAAVSARL